MTHRGRGSIVRRLVTVTLVVGLVTGLVGLLLVQELERRERRAERAGRNLAAAERTAALVDERIDALTAQLRLLASVPAVATLAAEANTDLAIALRISDEFDELVLYGPGGDPVAAAASSSLLDPAELPPLSPDGSPGPPPRARIDASDGLPNVELAVAVEDPPGTPVGVLVGRAPVAMITAEAEGQLLESDVMASVVDRDGRLLAGLQLDRVLAEERFPIDALLTQDRRVGSVRYDGESMLAAAAPLSSMPGWLVLQQPEHSALEPAEARLADVTSVLLVVVLAIVTAVILTGRRLLRGLRPLAIAVEKLGRGERGIRVEATGSGEAGILQEGFNRMAVALEQREDDLVATGRAARDSEERLRLMVEGVEDYAIVLLDRDGAVRSWNTGAVRLLRAPPEAALGRAFTSFLAPGQQEKRDPVVEARAGTRSELDTWCLRSDDEPFRAHLVVTALRNDDGEPYGFAVILHDLTERHAAQRAVERALDREREAAGELRRANELKDEFLAIAAHEIRTPLSAVLGTSSLLSEHASTLTDEERLRFLRMLEMHADDMRVIIDRLLDFSRLQAGRVRLSPEVMRIDAELRHHVELLGRQLAHHAVVVEAPTAEVYVDRPALRHIVTNLLSNAAKFSPEGSTITLRGQMTDGSLSVAVHNVGPGIPKEDHDRIFQLFRQSSNVSGSARGTGVGLAIVHRYVELLAGSIHVDSAPHRGATFTVRLPDVGAGDG